MSSLIAKMQKKKKKLNSTEKNHASLKNHEEIIFELKIKMLEVDKNKLDFHEIIIKSHCKQYNNVF